MATLSVLNPTDAERAEARTALLAAAGDEALRSTAWQRWNVDPSGIDGNVFALAVGEHARQAVRDLVAAVRSVSQSQSWLAWLANNK